MVDEQPKQEISVDVKGDVEGELLVAGRDIVTHKYEQKTIIQRLPLPVLLGVLGVLVAGLVIVVVVLLRGQQQAADQSAEQVATEVSAVGESVSQEIEEVGEGIDQVGEVLSTIAAPTPTLPPPFEAAQPGEILIVVPDFTGTEGVTAATRIYRALSNRVSEQALQSVRVERLEGTAPEVRQDARAVADEFGATLVIWGTADEYAFEPFYEIKMPEYVRAPDGTLLPTLGTTLNTDLPAFTAYVVEGAPNDFQYLMLFSIGQILLLSERAEQAVPLLEEAAALELSDAASLESRALLYFYLGLGHDFLGDLNGALEDYNQAAEIFPDMAEIYNNRGYVHARLGDLNAALADFTRAIELRPKSVSVLVRAYNNRANTYLSLGDNESAIADSSRSIELDPENGLAYNNRASAYDAMGDHERAIADYDRAIELDPENGAYYAGRGWAYDQMGNVESALADYDKFLELATGNEYYYEFILERVNALRSP